MSQIDKLNLESFSNLEYWVHQLTLSIESIFIERLRESLKLWIELFENDFSKPNITGKKMIKRTSGTEANQSDTEVVPCFCLITYIY
jgi:dynein heavy chain 1